MGNRPKKSRFVKSGAAVQYQQRMRNIRKRGETGNDCSPSFDTDRHLFSTYFKCTSLSAAGSKSNFYHIQDHHTYISAGSFSEINENFFTGKLRSLDRSSLKNPLEFLPAGVCGHLVVKCSFCFKFVNVPIGKMHALQNTDHKPIFFDVNTKIGTGMYKII